MASKYSELHFKKNRLEHELVFLFGKQLIEQSDKLSVNQMYLEAELVAEGTKQLLGHTGQPEAQRRIIKGMSYDTTMALCKWIRQAL